MKRTLLFVMACFVSKLSFANHDPAPLNRANDYFVGQKFAFEQNKGQITGADASKVTYFLKSQDMTFFLLKNGIAYQFNKQNRPANSILQSPEQQLKKPAQEQTLTETYRMDMLLLGANPNPTITAEHPVDASMNYLGKNIAGVQKFTRITYHDIYPNIDWVVYIKDGQVEYDFVVRPNGDPNKIRFQGKWVEKMQRNADGTISLDCRLGKVTQHAPLSFQDGKTIASTAVVEGTVLRFDVADYNQSQTLTIDPVVGWATYYGGLGTEVGTSVVVDASNNIYLSGYTNSDTNIAFGGYQNSLASGNYDAFLAKFNASGTLLWATYYGGTGTDKGNAVALDPSGNVYMAGMTSSGTGIASAGAQQGSNAGLDDAFLVKFDPDGNRLWATYFGGEYFDEGYSCAVDNAGNVYMSGFAWSSTGITTAGAHQQATGGATDAFLVKYDSNGVRQWSTYYGGELWETGYCATDPNGNVYLAGFTSSTVNIATPGAHQTVIGWGDDGYLVKFNSDGVRQWGTYYGGSNYDWAYFIDTDSQGNIYLDGHTGSPEAISTPGSFQPVIAGNYDAYLAKFDPDGTRIWGTYYGGLEQERSTGCVIDSNDNIFLIGYANSSTGISSPGAYQQTYGGNQDAFAAKFNSDGERIWGTYIGGDGAEMGNFCTIDAAGNVYFTGYTGSTANISTPDGHQPIFGGSQDAFLLKLTNNGSLATKEVSSTGFEIYPNPTTDILEIASNATITSVTLFDPTGKQLMQLDNPGHRLSLATYPTGVYLMKVAFEDGQTEMRKIVKK
ncbi:DUF7948 domain-containing protein [Flavobacterium caeni]|uniref:Por secretion system C-terminal sorting domain-containing protein n=1 Tax=Flavobacterium caeni TaxID=490189 RepID=A0A1G5JR70_9FLAO|nr:SBBP repeat-containing protein [Flavobacterium caeni]SCY90360.1 Por secretion system C-terminal sorting domain-containing protein [Flavobacterium caeni]